MADILLLEGQIGEIAGQPDIQLIALIAGSIVVGAVLERWRAKLARRRWRSKREPFQRKPKPADTIFWTRSTPISTRPDAADQLRVVTGARFDKRPLLSWSEMQVLHAAEAAIRETGVAWRVMAQVSLGEILSSPSAEAYGAINSKRVDLLIVSQSGDPIAAIEYQGHGHYQGSAPARDAVKKEALRKAGVRYVEMTPEHGPEDLAHEISRIIRAVVPAAVREEAAPARAAMPILPDQGK